MKGLNHYTKTLRMYIAFMFNGGQLPALTVRLIDTTIHSDLFKYTQNM